MDLKLYSSKVLHISCGYLAYVSSVTLHLKENVVSQKSLSCGLFFYFEARARKVDTLVQDKIQIWQKGVLYIK